MKMQPTRLPLQGNLSLRTAARYTFETLARLYEV
jgi:hypothetical protein